MTNWIFDIRNLDCAGKFPTLPAQPDLVRDLRTLDIGPLLKELASKPQRYGLLPRLATHSELSIGGVISASFCERVNSMGKLTMTDKTTRLAHDTVDKLVTLRINKTDNLHQSIN